MDFSLRPELVEQRARVRAFMDAHVLPNEAQIVTEDRDERYDTLGAVQQRARDEGLWVPHLPRSLGGLGLGPMGMGALFREMGRSLVGPRAFNCDAPDQGNMDLLLRSGTEAQRERYLGPLVDAEITSAFCMTEPMGAGADPQNLRTTARPDGDGWVLEGHKWYSTGGGAAAFFILMARTSDDPRNGASMFLVDRNAEGVEHVRDIDVFCEPLLAHREAELRFHGVRLGPEALLGGVGDGFRLAQKRLVPARLTHCMRWLGLADRTMALCRPYLKERTSFGRPLSEHQMVQQKMAQNALDIHAGNLMTLHCAWMLEQGQDKAARPYSSMAKLHVARLMCRLLDDAIQLHGGLGFSRDMPFGDWYRMIRSGRIVDGPDEVHLFVIARDYFRERLELLV